MDNWYFSLIAHKAGPRTFDLSTGMNYVSMKDQIVRATNLVNALIRSRCFDSSAEEFDLIVVGAGAAGVSAACHAAHHGLNVLVLEKEAHRFPLQRHCKSRHVTLSMYDWPEPHVGVGGFPTLGDLPVKSSPAGALYPSETVVTLSTTADLLVEEWDAAINAGTFKGKIDWQFFAVVQPPPRTKSLSIMDVADARPRTINYRIDKSRHTASASIVIFATGIGAERSIPMKTNGHARYQPPSFWVDLPNPPWETGKDFTSRKVVLSGAGDGAIQDFLKIVYRDATSNLLSLIDKCGVSDKQKRAIVSAERHVERQLLWNTPADEAYRRLQDVYSIIADEILEAQGGDPLGTKAAAVLAPEISWVTSTGNPSDYSIVFTKTYPLNRLLATLTLKILYSDTESKKKIVIVSDAIETVEERPAATYRCHTKNGAQLEADFPPLLRHGIDTADGYGRNAGYFQLRSALAGAPLQFKPSDFPVKPAT